MLLIMEECKQGIVLIVKMRTCGMLFGTSC